MDRADATRDGRPGDLPDDRSDGSRERVDPSEGLLDDDWTRPRPASAPPAPLPDPPARPLFAEGPYAAPAQAGTRQGQQGHPGTERDGRTGHGDEAALAPGDGARSGFFAGFSGFGDDTTDTAARQRSTGAGNGSVPPAWGPDFDDPAEPETDPAAAHAGSSWLRLAAVIAGVLVLVVGVVVAFNLGRGASDEPGSTASGSPSGSSSRSASTVLRIAGVADFDPEGDPPDENPELVPLATDGKPGTAWQTLTYRGNPELGGLKSGVGLLVDLGRPRAVGSARVTLLGDGTSLELLAAPDATSAPSSADGLDRVASAENAGGRVDLTLDRPVTTRWLVVWLTKLPAVPGGFKGQVAEISVRS